MEIVRELANQVGFQVLLDSHSSSAVASDRVHC